MNVAAESPIYLLVKRFNRFLELYNLKAPNIVLKYELVLLKDTINQLIEE